MKTGAIQPDGPDRFGRLKAPDAVVEALLRAG